VRIGAEMYGAGFYDREKSRVVLKAGEVMNTSAYRIERTLKIMGKPYRYIGLKHLEETSCRIRKLPVSIRILLENILRSNET